MSDFDPPELVGPKWADSLGGNSFVLEGMQFDNGAYGGHHPIPPGDKVMVAPTLAGGYRGMVILGSTGTNQRRRLTFNPFLAQNVANGEWDCPEGYPRMSYGVTAQRTLYDPGSALTVAEILERTADSSTYDFSVINSLNSADPTGTVKVKCSIAGTPWTGTAVAWGLLATNVASSATMQLRLLDDGSGDWFNGAGAVDLSLAALVLQGNWAQERRAGHLFFAPVANLEAGGWLICSSHSLVAAERGFTYSLVRSLIESAYGDASVVTHKFVNWTANTLLDLDNLTLEPQKAKAQLRGVGVAVADNALLECYWTGFRLDAGEEESSTARCRLFGYRLPAAPDPSTIANLYEEYGDVTRFEVDLKADASLSFCKRIIPCGIFDPRSTERKLSEGAPSYATIATGYQQSVRSGRFPYLGVAGLHEWWLQVSSIDFDDLPRLRQIACDSRTFALTLRSTVEGLSHLAYGERYPGYLAAAIAAIEAEAEATQGPLDGSESYTTIFVPPPGNPMLTSDNVWVPVTSSGYCPGNSAYDGDPETCNLIYASQNLGYRYREYALTCVPRDPEDYELFRAPQQVTEVGWKLMPGALYAEGVGIFAPPTPRPILPYPLARCQFQDGAEPNGTVTVDNQGENWGVSAGGCFDADQNRHYAFLAVAQTRVDYVIAEDSQELDDYPVDVIETDTWIADEETVGPATGFEYEDHLPGCNYATGTYDSKIRRYQPKRLKYYTVQVWLPHLVITTRAGAQTILQLTKEYETPDIYSGSTGVDKRYVLTNNYYCWAPSGNVLWAITEWPEGTDDSIDIVADEAAYLATVVFHVEARHPTTGAILGRASLSPASGYRPYLTRKAPEIRVGIDGDGFSFVEIWCEHYNSALGQIRQTQHKARWTSVLILDETSNHLGTAHPGNVPACAEVASLIADGRHTWVNDANQLFVKG